MGTRCLFIFKQSFDAKEAHGVYVHYDGYPRGAADYLEDTFKSGNTWTVLRPNDSGCSRWEADEFASGFVGSCKEHQIRYSQSKWNNPKKRKQLRT